MKKLILSLALLIGLATSPALAAPRGLSYLNGDADILLHFDLQRLQKSQTFKDIMAMAMGKAVIASKLPALEEIIQHEKTGLLYTPDNLQSLVDSIEKCIEDDGLVQELGDSARNWIKENRTWDIVVKNTLKAYEIAKAG